MLPPFDLGVLGTDPGTQKVLPKASLLGPQTAFLVRYCLSPSDLAG